MSDKKLPKDQQIDRMQKEMNDMREVIRLLRNHLPSSVAGTMPQQQERKKIRITTYQEDDLSPPKIVLGYVMTQNDVYTDLETGRMTERQTVKLILDPLESEKPKVSATQLMTYIEKSNDPEKIAKHKADLEKLQNGFSVTLPYRDWFKRFKKQKTVEVVEERVKDGQKFYVFNWTDPESGKESEKMISEKFIN